MIELVDAIEKISEKQPQKIKKFVIQVYDENISFIESLSSEKKNLLINNLIESYRTESFKVEKKKSVNNKFKKIIILTFLLILGIPLFVMFVNFSLEATLNSYSHMEKNFEKLFD